MQSSISESLSLEHNHTRDAFSKATVTRFDQFHLTIYVKNPLPVLIQY